MMTDDQIVEFVRKHPCKWNNAMFGWAYHFDFTDEQLKNIKRSPFTARRLNRLIGEGRILRVDDTKEGQWWVHGHLEAVK